MRLMVELTKYLLIILMALYTYFSYSVFRYKKKPMQDKIYRRMTILIFVIHFFGTFTLYLQVFSDKLLLLYGEQVILFTVILFLYQKFYPTISRLLLRNMLMLLSVGFIILARLSYDKVLRQVMIVAVAFAVSLLVPYIISRFTWLQRLGWLYGVIGIGILLVVLLFGIENYGATNWLDIEIFTFQPSELVKILFVISIAALFHDGTDFKRVCAITVMAAANVMILVLQKDLGGALIFFVTYIFMLYVATDKPLYFFGGLMAGALASIIAYQLFDHVRVRVMAWQDPMALIDKEGYQVSQSLFAIGTGGWFGLGINQGLPTSIPVVDSDFIFSAISEELGGLFALSIIMIYINCFIMLINISLGFHEVFYRLISLGFAVMFGFQVFLSIGGVIKFIPSTGVTLPFISYGGSSVFATIVMFMILQGIYRRSSVLKKNENEHQAGEV